MRISETANPDKKKADVALDDIRDDEPISIPMACRVIGGVHTPISVATFYRGVAAKRYPAPFHPAPGVARVLMGECRAIIAKARAKTALGPKAA
jgi:hypothetical protein